jgi:hypothetical protein
VIGELTQTCRDFGSWQLSAAARKLIDCPG